MWLVTAILSSAALMSRVLGIMSHRVILTIGVLKP